MPKIIKPTSYGTLPPPKKGGVYIDSALPTPITRMTDAKSIGLPSVTVEYSTATPVNNNDTRFLALLGGGAVALYDLDSNYINTLPGVLHSSEPRWSRKDANSLYYISGGNNVVLLDTVSLKATIVSTFGYKNIYGMGESDISEDGDHLVLSGGLTDNHGDNRTIFVYEISSNRTSVSITWPTAFNNLYITPDNNVLVSAANGVFMMTHTKGEIDTWNWGIRLIAPTMAHQDVTRNSDGDEVLIRANSADPSTSGNCPNGIEMVRLANGDRQCILPLGWSPRGGPQSLACHISCSDNGRVLVSTYAPSNPTIDQWEPYTNELITVDLKGLVINRIAHHRSIKLDDYQYEPKGSISRSGSIILYNSNWGMGPANYADVYKVQLSQAAPALPIDSMKGWHKIPYKPGTEYRLIVNPDGTQNFWEKD